MGTEKRLALDKRIAELTRLRARHIEDEERRAEAAGSADGFDVAAKKSLRNTVKAKSLSGLSL